MTAALPSRALSVRQPWAWAIIHAGKDVENRSVFAVKHMSLCVDLAIHAAKGMTRDEYDEGAGFMATLGITCPKPADLVRGAIIGAVAVDGVAKTSASPWFFGPRALLLRDAAPCDPIPAVGALGIFAWRDAPDGNLATPAKWMLALSSDAVPAVEPQKGLF